jgi:hypothetical protein
MVYTYSVIMNDAYYFLSQSQGLPDIPSAEPLRQRYFRACVVFSWMAIEEMLDYSTTELLRQKKLDKVPKGGLLDRLDRILAIRGASKINAIEFKALRRIRNRITHPISTAADDELLDATQTRAGFDYCLKLLELISPHEFMIKRHNGPMTERVLKDFELGQDLWRSEPWKA